MTNARRLLGVGAFLGLVSAVSLSRGEPVRPGATGTPAPAPAPSYLSTPAHERTLDKTQDQSPFAKGGVFTYLPGDGKQLFAIGLKPELPKSAAKGRDVLIMLSLSATQAGDGWQASTRILEMLVKNLGDNDRVSLWTIGTPKVTESVLKETDGFLSPKNAEHMKKIDAAYEKIKVTYPSGDTDLKGGITKAMKAFVGSENRQRILVFLGDGQSTHDPLDADARYALAQEMVAKKIGFFPVPLGTRIHPENLHGLATGTGGLVLRTQVGSELLGPVIDRYLAAFKTPILYDVKATLPSDVTIAYPTKLPPLRSDASTLVVGWMKPSDPAKFVQAKVGTEKDANGKDVDVLEAYAANDFGINVTGTMVGNSDPIAMKVTEKVHVPVIDHFFLASLVNQWENAKDRPAILAADRTLGIAYEQTRLHRDELLITAQLAVRDLKLEEAARAFTAAKRLAPHDTAPDAGLRLVDRVKKGVLPPEAMKKMLQDRKGVQVMKGKKAEEVVIHLAKFAQDEKEANLPVIPAPGAQARDDLLQQHRDLGIIQEQKWTEIVENTLRQARRELTQDPDGTMDALRNVLSRVRDNPTLSERVRSGLASRLQSALTEAKSQSTILKVNKEQINRNVAVAKSLYEREQQARTLQDRQEEQLRSFRSQIEIAYFDEKTKRDVLANLLALQTENRLRGQNWPVAAQADYEMVLAGYNLEKSNELRRLREDRFLATMVALDKSFIPFPDEPGIEFPKLATWKQLTKYRKERYEVSDIPTTRRAGS